MPRLVDRRWIPGLFAAVFVSLCAGDAGALPDAVGYGQPFDVAVSAQEDGFESPDEGVIRGVVRGVRQSVRSIQWMFSWAVRWWGDWFRRGAFALVVAVGASLADVGLLNAFRTRGMRALATYIPLMLYVYSRLFFSRGVTLAPKLLLIGALVYGAMPHDLVPDQRLSDRIEDVVLVVLATRVFLYACPDELVHQFAASAVNWRRRVASIQSRSR